MVALKNPPFLLDFHLFLAWKYPFHVICISLQESLNFFSLRNLYSPLQPLILCRYQNKKFPYLSTQIFAQQQKQKLFLKQLKKNAEVSQNGLPAPPGNRQPPGILNLLGYLLVAQVLYFEWGYVRPYTCQSKLRKITLGNFFFQDWPFELIVSFFCPVLPKMTSYRR